jgi:O-antigen/teichoic acid export membrane protein
VGSNGPIGHGFTQPSRNVRPAYCNRGDRTDTVCTSLPATAQEGLRLSRLRQLLRLVRLDVAKDSVTGFAYEGTLLFSTLLSFSLLGRSLGEYGYGHYAALYAIVAPLTTLAATGVALAQAEHVIRRHEDLESTSQSCLALSILSGLLLTAIGTLIATIIVSGLTLWAIVPIMLLEFVSYPAILIAASTVQIHEGYAMSSRFRIVPILFRITIIVVLYVTGHLTIATLGVTYLAVSVGLCFVIIPMVGRRYGIALRPGRIRPQHFKTGMVYSFGVSGLALQNDGDKLVMQSYNLTSQVGLYSAAYKIVQFGLLPVTTFMSVSHNRFLEHDENKKGQHLRRAIRWGGVCSVYGAVFALAIAAAAPLITLLVGNSFEGSVTMVRWLGPLVLFRALAIFPLNGLMGLGHTRLRTGLLVASAVLSLGLYISLVPFLDWKGAALGTLIGEGTLAFTSWALLIRLERKHDRRVDARLRALPSLTTDAAATAAS